MVGRAAVGVLFSLLSGVSLASAQTPTCASLGLPHPVYGVGGSSITPSLARVAAELAKLPQPITILYSDPAACSGFEAFIADKVKTDFKYWTADEVVNPDVKHLIEWYDGTALPPGGVNVVGLAIDAGDVPLCAMRVTREGFTGAVSSWAPEVPCGHFFEARASGSTDGVQCTVDEACGAGKCRFGYCEPY